MFNASESANTSEANSKNRQRKAMTASNLFIQIIQAGGGNPVTFRSRKNAANGNMVISASANQTGLLQDTTSGHTDSLAVGDDFDISYQYSAGSGTTAQVLQGVWLTSSNGDSIYSCANDQGTSFDTSVTAYAGLCGGLEITQTSETNAQVTVNSAFTFSQLLANIISNSISSASTLTLRANAGNAGSVAVSIGANSTGIFVDATDTYTAATTDAMNYKLTTGTTGTSISISHLSVWGNISAAAATTRPSYRHFDMRPNRILNQQYNPFASNQMVIFG
jgi:hypothetical protein